MVLPDSHRVSRVPRYLGVLQERLMNFVYGAITLYGGPSQALSLSNNFVTLRLCRTETRSIPQPRIYNACGLDIYSVWADPRSLAATSGISIDVYSWRYLDVSVPSVRLLNLCIRSRITRHNSGWVPPFRNPRIKAYLAAPRSLSQLVTSFIAYCRQGIHRVPLIA